MKRKSLIFFLLLALFAPLAMNAQSTHPWGSSSTNSGSDRNANPFGRFYGYEYRVYLYPPNTMNGVSGDITKLEFLPNSTMSSTGGQIDVWMKSVTDVTSLSSSTTFATYKSGATLVYTNSSSPSYTSGSYVSLPLSTPVAYNYSNNEYLMILVRSVASSSSGDSGSTFYYYNPANASNNTWYAKKDGSDPGENTISGFSTLSTGAYLPVIRVTYTTSTNPSISLNPAAATVFTGFTQTLTANLRNVSGTPTITYTSSNTNVATVSGSGTTATVTAVAPGTATITASMTYQGTTYTATCAITVEDPSYCSPSFSSTSDYITNFTLGGINNSTGFSTNGYGDYTSQSASLEQGVAATASLTSSSGSGTHAAAVWIDFNDNYVFESSERVGTQDGIGASATVSISLAIPNDAAVGNHRMRVVYQYYVAATSIVPCASASYGEGEDYTVNIIPASTEPSITLAPETASLILGSTLALTATVRNVNDPTITYTSSDTSVATVSGNGTTATVTSVAEGTVTITASMTVGGTTYSATSTITIQDTPLRSSNGNYYTWEYFAANPRSCGSTIYLERDITVSTIVTGSCWTTNTGFNGTFDGQGHTITINHTATQDFTGLFRYTYAPTIKNLKLEGTINSAYPNTASLIGMSQGTTNVENVISNVTINSTATGVAGMIAGIPNKVYFKGCAFTGSLNGTSSTQNGGFVGRMWYEETHSYTNCLFAPSSISSDLTGASTFDVYASSTFTNSYYTEAFGTTQGKQAYTVTGVSPVNVAMNGTATNYNTSGITAYASNSGLLFNGTIYAGDGDNVKLDLSGSATGYVADHGTLAENGSIYTLTMEANNTIITYNITLTKTIAAVGNENWEDGKGGYYLVASPIAQDVDPATVGMLTADENTVFTYDFYRFDQDPSDASGLEWRNYREHNFDLVNGQGYLYASKNGTTLTFSGMPYSGTSKIVTLSKTSGVEFEGFNLVGNPFADDAYITKSFYTLENSDTYTLNTAGTPILAMQGLLVVADSDEEPLTFSTEPSAGSKVAKLNMNVSKNRNVVDQAIISFNEGQQLPKLQFRNGSTKVYMPKDGKEYAIVSAESMGTMPVNFKPEENGTYTLSFTAEEVSFSYLHLIDNMTGEDVDLLAGASTGSATYTFEARTTDYESRFKLVFAKNDGPSTGSGTFAFYSNGSFVINNEGNATLQVIDVNGRILKSESINGCANVNVNAAQGIYMLRLVNGNDVKVQKVVVR